MPTTAPLGEVEGWACAQRVRTALLNLYHVECHLLAVATSDTTTTYALMPERPLSKGRRAELTACLHGLIYMWRALT